MTLNLKRFLLIIALTLPLAQIGYAQEEEPEGEQSEAQEEENEARVTDYIEMKPPFVTHVGEPSVNLVYLKAAVTLRASKESTRPAVETHMPKLRHELIMLFGEQTNVDSLASNTGQNELRKKALERINQVLEEQQTGESISDVLFTEFVVQR